MNLRLQFDTLNIDWSMVVDILREAGMKYYTEEAHERAFNKSHAVVFVFDDKKLVGTGRCISDGEYQAAIYDVAVLPSYQRMGIGTLIINKLIDETPGCNFILYASPGKEQFYEKLDFSRMKTGMALFRNQNEMRSKGFIS